MAAALLSQICFTLLFLDSILSAPNSGCFMICVIGKTQGYGLAVSSAAMCNPADENQMGPDHYNIHPVRYTSDRGDKKCVWIYQDATLLLALNNGDHNDGVAAHFPGGTQYNLECMGWDNTKPPYCARFPFDPSGNVDERKKKLRKQ